MKNICKKIDISYVLIILIFVSLLSGLFKDIITFFIIIIIHETGHIITSIYFKWNISKIKFGICGGFITYDDVIDKPFYEEFLISISGILFQLLFYLVCIVLLKNNIIDNKVMFLINKYNTAILIFNMIPIIPLDGSKILMVILCMFIPYKKALNIMFCLSFLLMFCLIFMILFYKINFEYSYIMVIAFIIKKIIEFYKDIPYLFNKFLFERFFYPIKCIKKAYINGYNYKKMRRQRLNYFIINNHKIEENVILSKKFDYFNKV